MNQLLQDLHQPSWWVGVVIVGFIVGIASSYARDVIDHTTQKIVGWNRDRNLSKKQRFEKVVTILSQSSDKRIYYSIKAIELRQRSYLRYFIGFLFGLLAAFSFSISIWRGGIILLASCLWLVLATSDLAQANGIRHVVDAAQDESEEREDTNLPL